MPACPQDITCVHTHTSHLLCASTQQIQSVHAHKISCACMNTSHLLRVEISCACARGELPRNQGHQRHHCGYSAKAFKARAQWATARHQGDCLQEAHCEAHPMGRTWGAVELDRIHVGATVTATASYHEVSSKEPNKSATISHATSH